MKWNRKTLRTVAMVFLSVVVASVIAKVSTDDGTSTASDNPPAVSSGVATGGGTGDTGDASGGGTETGDVDPDSGLPIVREDDLPAQGQATLALIDQGGPFPDAPKDGSTFGNFEGLLPERGRGYYREYTVLHPGTSSRGAKRIITGDGGELYWTEDHYESFERIVRT